MFDDILKQEKFSRKDLSLIYAIKTLNELVDLKIVEGKPFEITEKGFDAIKDFKPTDDELKEAMYSLSVAGYIK